MNEQSIFVTALERDPAERQAFLEGACAGNPQLRQRVQKLLATHENAVRFMDLPDDPMAATLVRPVAEGPGTQIGPYKLLERIGEGGMGVVYMAEQKEPVERRVALKVIKPGMDTGQVIARFEAERQALALMDHPNIAKVLDAGATDSGRPYFVMELVNGIPITRYCDEEHLTPRERLELFVPVCQAVQHAHQKGIIHRDLKPSNILIALYDHQPVPKVIDFGVAKATAQRLTEKTVFTGLGQIVGTLEYMSPEQAQRNQLDIDTRSDVYSLGVVLYELLTGTTPVERKRLRTAGYDEILRMIREEETPRPSLRLSSIQTLPSIAANRRTEPSRLRKLLRNELDWIVLKALEKDRGRRYETANGFAADVQRYLNDEAVVACPPSAGYRFRKFARRNKAILVTASLIAAALLVGLAGTTQQMWRAIRAEHQAEQEKDVAQEQEKLARAAEQDAVEQRDRAVAAEQRLEKELRIATATRIAAQSELTRESPIRSTLLAVEAVEATRRYSEPIVPVAHEALLKSVAELGGRPLGNRHSFPEMSPNGRWLITCRPSESSASGEARLWDLTAEDPAASSLLLQGTHDVTSVATSNRWAVTAHSTGDAVFRLWDLTAENPAAAAASVLRGRDREGFVLAISPDERWLITRKKMDYEARLLWDLTAEDSDPSPIVSGGTSQGKELFFSPDGRWLITLAPLSSGDPRHRLLWDLTQRNPASSPIRLEAHERKYRERAAIDPNSRWLVTEYGQTAKLWDLKALAEDPSTRPIELKVQDSIGSLTFTPDGRRLAIGTGNGALQLWDIKPEVRPTPSAVLSGGPQGAVRIAISDRWLVTVTYVSTSEGATIALWDLHAEVPAPVGLQHHPVGISTLEISPNDRWLVAASSDGRVWVWDLKADNPAASAVVLRAFDGPVGIASAMISENSRWLVTSGRAYGGARLWALEPHPVSSPLKLTGNTAIAKYWIHTSDGRWLVTGSADATIRVWDLESDNPARSAKVLRDHDAPIRCLNISRDDRWLVSVDEDRIARVWEFRAGDPVPVKELPHDTEIDYAFISPNNRWVLTGTPDVNYLWDLAEADLSPIELEGTSYNTSRPSYLSWVFSPDSRWLLTRHPTGMLYDLESPHPTSSPIPLGRASTDANTENGDECAFAISNDSRWLAMASAENSEDATARLWDLQSHDPASYVELAEHTKPVQGVVFSPSNDRLYTISDDETVRRWDLASEEPASSPLVLQGGTPNVLARAISQDGRWLATASQFGIRLWDLTDVNRSAFVLPKSGLVVISSDSRWLWTVASGRDRNQRLWDLRADNPAKSSRTLPWPFPGGCSLSPDGRWVTAASGTTFQMWDLDVDSQLSRARRLAGRELTQEERERYGLPAK